jgi:ABC-type sugar transport system substrate-binding protein
VACCTTDVPDGALDYVVGTPAQIEQVGKLMAAWVIADSKGEGDSVYVDLSAFKILTTVRDGYNKTMDELCPACGYDSLDIPITALGKDVPDRIVSYLRAHPETKYVVFSTDGISAGVPAALRAAGLNDVKLTGEGPDETTLQSIANGERDGTLMFAYYEDMFSMVDALARLFAGVPLEEDIELPDWYVTAETMPDSNKIFPVVEDVKEQYFELWGITG